MTGDELRQAFLNFFEERGHKVIRSSSLVPHKDPSLLLTSAGMVQIKPYFLGLEAPPSQRLASCQKCFRTTDIDLVGDSKHLTFFEMLGNFSVGDYFRRETICWAWEFTTKYLKLPEERLWVTIYLDDEEAFAYWREVGIPSGKILRFGDEDNFWGPVGDSGPCGPCSEIHYDLGGEFGCGKTECKPNCDCGRFSEIWNLVFTQYNQDRDGRRTPLPKPNIDTGMGLERTLAAIQGKPSPYETDLFLPLIDRICHLSGKEYGRDENIDRAIRIVTEHSRGIAFLIADGVMPLNESRGYVLRRILRRASLFGRRLGLDKPFLGEMAEIVISQMGDLYPELIANRGLIKEVIKDEEERFIGTLDTGLNAINATFQQMQESIKQLAEQVGKAVQPIQEIKGSPAFQQMQESIKQLAEQVGKAVQPIQEIKGSPAFQQMQESIKQLAEQVGKAVRPIQEIKASPATLQALEQVQETIQQIPKIVTITGREVFKLHDTFGFPKELTAEIAKERGLSIDWEGFQAEMEKQREKARAAHEIALAETVVLRDEAVLILIPRSTDFVGHRTLKHHSTVVGLLPEGKWLQNQVDFVSKGQYVGVILGETPFYGEMGGQVGDTGEIRGKKGRITVTNTVKHTVSRSELVVHQGKVIEGQISVNDDVEAEVDESRRLDIARNHTATHLLQAALRQILGKNVSQRGSLVEPERSRFDFSHLAPITEEELEKVQRRVNEWIRQNLAVKAKTLPYAEAVAEGAIALFEEKYGEEVRMLTIGEPAISKELCGGTHVKSTGELGTFLITSESSIGTGLHRIEAMTGREAESLIESRSAALQHIATEVESSVEEVPDKVKALVGELEVERKRALSLERELSQRVAEDLPGQAMRVSGVTVLAARVPPLTMPVLREMGDVLRDKLKSAVVVLATVHNGKPSFLAMVTPDLVAKGFHAGDIIDRVAKVTGGGGGGKAAMAQAGGKDATKVDEALRLVKSVVASQIP
jgi:alanyl-tRNA synthetase